MAIIDEPPSILQFGRETKAFIDNLESILAPEVHRVQVVTDLSRASCRLVKFLGFEAEGLLRSYGADKQDNMMWGKVLCR